MNYSLQNKERFVSKEQVIALLDRHMADNNWNSVLLLPPDITRSHSGAGIITAHYYAELTKRGVSVKVLPALGYSSGCFSLRRHSAHPFPGWKKSLVCHCLTEPTTASSSTLRVRFF